MAVLRLPHDARAINAIHVIQLVQQRNEIGLRQRNADNTRESDLIETMIIFTDVELTGLYLYITLTGLYLYMILIAVFVHINHIDHPRFS